MATDAHKVTVSNFSLALYYILFNTIRQNNSAVDYLSRRARHRLHLSDH